MIEICAVGGYSEFGRNMTAIKIDDEVIIIDMGLHMNNYIKIQGDDDTHNLNVSNLTMNEAIPNYKVIKQWKKKVKAIIPTHAHLDHVGAIPFISNKFNADILCTPFTAEVIKSIIKDDRRTLKNPIKKISPNSNYKISKNLSIDFINVTHSTPQTVMVAINSKYGTIIYSNDFKFDSNPTLGQKPNFDMLKSYKKVLGLIVDCTRAWDLKKTPSEMVAKEMLKDVMLGTDSTKKTIVVTTFSSHIARLRSIVEFSKNLKRKPIFLGRSLAKYIEAAQDSGVANFSDVEIVKYSEKMRKVLNKISKKTDKYVLVVTGHQGEPESVLSKMTRGDLPFKFKPEDLIIFSCTIIPHEINRQNREKLEAKLKKFKTRIFTDIHVSGHAAREDIRDLINMTNPMNIIPAHGDTMMMNSLKELCNEMDFDNTKFHMMKNGDFLKLID
jgi:ribonuclease J